jgi:hypothetical protein
LISRSVPVPAVFISEWGCFLIASKARLCLQAIHTELNQIMELVQLRAKFRPPKEFLCGCRDIALLDILFWTKSIAFLRTTASLLFEKSFYCRLFLTFW